MGQASGRRLARVRVFRTERELRLARLLVAVGLPAPVRQYELWDNGAFVARFDHAYPKQRIAADFDSYRHHFGRQAWVRDRARLRRVTALDWLVFMFTDADLRNLGATAPLVQAYKRRTTRPGGWRPARSRPR